VKGKPTVERTLILVKPDGVARGLTGEILNRFERKGLKIVAAKMVKPTNELAKSHYQEHEGNGQFFKNMCEALTCGPNLAVVLEGELAIAASRQIIGFASPIDQSPIGTIRGDFAIFEPKNLVHGSDSKNAAAREIKLWFGENLLLKPSDLQKAASIDATGKWSPPKKVPSKKVVPKAAIDEMPELKPKGIQQISAVDVNPEIVNEVIGLLGQYKTDPGNLFENPFKIHFSTLEYDENPVLSLTNDG
jgi:nucleoside-diphosphate kinase